MKRMLCIVGGMNAGGAETFLMKLYRGIDKSKYQMDFAVAIDEKGCYDDEIKGMGGIIHHITPKTKGVAKNFWSIYKLVKENRYKYVLRTSQHSLSAMELLAAWIGGAKIRIFRSSNSNTTSGRKKDLLLHKLFIFMPRFFANIKIAPSTIAAEYMFGKGCIAKKEAYLLHNAVDLDVYQFSKEDREKVRKSFGILDDEIVIGHVGRFNQQKNHLFLLGVFRDFLKKHPNSKLMLVGTGELENEIQNRIKELDIVNQVILLGVRSDIAQLLSAFDVFLFPSIYEGMPNTVIEAQAAGLPCVVSDKITPEVKISKLVLFESLSNPNACWIKKIDEAISIGRCNVKNDLEGAGYSIDTVVKDFIKLSFERY